MLIQNYHSEHSDRTVQSTVQLLDRMVQPLRSNGTAPRTEQIELFGATHRTVLNLSDRSLQKKIPLVEILRSVQVTAQIRTLRSSSTVNRSNCSEYSDRMTVLSTPIE